MAALAMFVGGPLDGRAEPLRICPAELTFSSARISGEWEDGPVVVCDVVYRRSEPPAFEPGGWLPMIEYRWAS